MDLIKNKNIKITKNATTNVTQLTKKGNNITRNYSTTTHNNKVIKPKSYQDVMIGVENKFMTMDIETVNTNNNTQIPIAITLCTESKNKSEKQKLVFRITSRKLI